MVLSFLQTSCLALLSGLLLIPFILGASFGIYKCLLIFKNRWNETARLDETSGKITNFFSFVVLLILKNDSVYLAFLLLFSFVFLFKNFKISLIFLFIG